MDFGLPAFAQGYGSPSRMDSWLLQNSNVLHISYRMDSYPPTPIHFHCGGIVMVWVSRSQSLQPLYSYNRIQLRVLSFLPDFQSELYTEYSVIFSISTLLTLVFFLCLESSLSGKTHPSTPAMYKFRPSFGTMPKVHYHTAGEKVRHDLFSTYVLGTFLM